MNTRLRGLLLLTQVLLLLADDFKKRVAEALLKNLIVSNRGIPHLIRIR